MVKLPWITWMDPKCNRQHPYKKEADGDTGYKDKRRGQSDQGLREWGDAATAKECWQLSESRNKLSPLQLERKYVPINTETLAW